MSSVARARAWVAVVAVFPLILGCSASPGGNDGGEGVRIELGTGGSRFEPIPDKGSDGKLPTLPIIAGPQGGHHIWGAVRAWELGDEVHVKYTVSLIDPAKELSVNEYDLSLSKSGDAYEWYGIIGLVPDPFEARDRTVELRMEVSTPDGVVLSDTRRAVATFSP